MHSRGKGLGFQTDFLRVSLHNTSVCGAVLSISVGIVVLLIILILALAKLRRI